jgi:ribosome-associated protein
VVDLASDKQATDVLLLDVHDIVSFADYMVIMSADSARQMNALVDELRQGMKEKGAALHHQEGTPGSGWMLLDFADVVVHIFAPEQREYYRLEEMWGAARPLVRIQ